MRKKHLKVMTAIIGMAYFMAGCGPTPTPYVSPTPIPTPTPASGPSDSQYFELTGEEYAAPYVGLGSQYNGSLYSDLSRYYGMNESNYADLEEKVIALGSQHIRVFYDEDPERVPTINNPEGYATDLNRQSFYKVLQLCQDTPNATVNITYWHTPQISEMAAFAAELKHIVKDLNLTCVQYITIQNEPNGGDGDVTKEELSELFKELDAQLKLLGVREDFKLISGDLVYNNQRAWLTYLGQELKDVVDGYSVHIYWNFWDIPYGMSRLTGTLADIASLPEDQRKPIYITEFGVRGYKDKTTPGGSLYNATSFPDPGVDAPNNPNARPMSESLVSAFQHGRYNIEALNAGIVALVRWDAYRAKYDGGMQDYSMIGLATEGYKLQPSYYQLLLMTAATTPGSTILKVIRKGSSTGFIRMCALRSPENVETFMFAHDFSNTRNMVVHGLTPGKSYNIYKWNANGDGLISNEGAVQVDEWGRLVIPLPTSAIAVATTANLSFNG